MPEARCDLGPLVGSQQLAANCPWVIDGNTQQSTDGTTVLIPGIDSGVTDAAGTFTTMVRYTANDSLAFNVLRLPSIGLFFPFAFRRDDLTDQIGEHISLWAGRHPEGVPTRENTPTPGPVGPVGPGGPQGIPGHIGATGGQGSQGDPGVAGHAGIDGHTPPHDIDIFIAAAAAPPLPIGSGTYDTATDTLIVVPPGWSAGPIVPPAGQTLWFARATIHRDAQGLVAPVWHGPGEAGEQGPIGPTGSRGGQGVPGVAGHDGGQGAMGDQGVPGHTGSTGSQGPRGDPGQDGQDGAGGLTYAAIQALPRHQPGRFDQFPFARVNHDDVGAAELETLAGPVGESSYRARPALALGRTPSSDHREGWSHWEIHRNAPVRPQRFLATRHRVP